MRKIVILIIISVFCEMVADAQGVKLKMAFPEPTLIPSSVDTPTPENKYGYFNLTEPDGKFFLQIDYSYQEANGFDHKRGIALVKQGGKWGYISTTGVPVIPIIYDNIWGIDEKDYLIAMKDGKWGVVTLNGAVVLPFIYDSIGSNDNGWFEVIKDGNYGYTNTTGFYTEDWSEYNRLSSQTE